MNSQELTHLHALLYEVRVELEDQDKVPAGAFSEYDSKNVRPDYIHRPQDAHEDGIRLLLKGIRHSIKRDPPPEKEMTM
ncbi:hypothetical protein EA462_02480 [Natrarchaeobius halalkaliphilus]|uniref:Metal-binding protein n=1 Tax=Natrarchaeobius halalkaliphilus TaxID=1679091 RepID=A0A3N6MCS7_9EURY|nr:UPF0058 family protein [Natrarchaeobius halalkaliphilus]RQG93311.1 hypothetical protein EA462_02480 [Natrarchaeobius halalkaliphilus]